MKYLIFLLFIFYIKGGVAQLSPTDIKQSACQYMSGILKGANTPQPPNNPFLTELSGDIVYGCSYTCQVGVQWCNERIRPSDEPDLSFDPDCERFNPDRSNDEEVCYQCDKKLYDGCLQEAAKADTYERRWKEAYEREMQEYQNSCFVPKVADCAKMETQAKQCARERIKSFYERYCEE